MTLVEARKGGARGAAVEEATITPNSDPVNPVNPENSKTGLPFTFFNSNPDQCCHRPDLGPQPEITLAWVTMQLEPFALA